MLERVSQKNSERLSFSIAGLGVEFDSQLTDGRMFQLPASFEPFACMNAEPAVRVYIRSRPSLGVQTARVIFDSRCRWRVCSKTSGPVFEFYHPPLSKLYVRGTTTNAFQRYNVVFDEGAWGAMWQLHRTPKALQRFEIPHPLDQLMIVLRLAQESGFLTHACGAV
ncbi:MAG: hypothetical protein L0312_11580, partial [Acidobacteria bacterium]|nr:hypothetical protein [Acidobacteriota bacterium]